MVEITLTETMIKHGKLDIPSAFDHGFPADCFGSRSGDVKGSTINLKFGPHQAMTDIRRKSTGIISPRRRFYAWFKNDLKAVPGDRICVAQLGPRSFELIYFPR